ncbi:MAG: hypothetical protein WD646_06240 [Actinomycetota bacterium]
MDTVTELADAAVDEIANQLGEAVETVEGTLGELGVDLDVVTDDVLDLVEQGIPLEEAVDQVLGLLSPVLPTPAPSGGGLGGLLGGLGL